MTEFVSQVYRQHLADDPADLPSALNGIANRRLLPHEVIVFDDLRFAKGEVID
jgi:hypothetical protein